MNRAMRRAAARAKPLEYQRVDLPRHIDEFAVFGDIERVLEKIEHGEIEFSQGVPVMLLTCIDTYPEDDDRPVNEFKRTTNTSTT